MKRQWRDVPEVEPPSLKGCLLIIAAAIAVIVIVEWIINSIPALNP